MRFLSRNGLMQLLGIKPKNAKMTIRTKLTDQQRIAILEAQAAEQRAMLAQQMASSATMFRGDPMWALSGSQSKGGRPAQRRTEPEPSRADDSSTSLATAMLYASALSSASSDSSSYSTPSSSFDSSPSSDSSSSFSSGGGGDFGGGGSSGSWD